jgi:SAM-dependent methyltransferase
MAADDYHLRELSIASAPGDPRRVMPPIEAGHRRILDVGCGAGQTLVASNLRPGVLAVGVDVDHSALLLGRRLSDTICFIRAEGEALPFENGSFDLIISRVAVPYMRVDGALAEMGRVLRPGGSLWLVLHPFRMTASELVTNITRLEFKAAVYRVWVLTNGLALHIFGRQWALPLKARRYESYQTERGVTRALSAAGFGHIAFGRGDHFVVTAKKIG